MIAYISRVEERDPAKWLIVTHHAPDWDAIAAVTMLNFLGDRQWPGIFDAEVTFNGDGGQNMSGVTEEELLADKILHVDFGGGRYDHHAHGGSEEKVGQCATSLVVGHLNSTVHVACPHLHDLVEYTLAVDSNGCSEDEMPFFIDRLFRQAGNSELIQAAFDIALWAISCFVCSTPISVEFEWQPFVEEFSGDDTDMINFLQQVTPENPGTHSLVMYLARMWKMSREEGSRERVYAIAQTFMTSYNQEQIELLETAKADFARAKIWTHGSGKKQITVAFVRSDCPMLGRHAKSRQGGDCTVFVQEFTTGRVIVFINRRHQNRINVADVVKAVRWNELVAKAEQLGEPMPELIPAKKLGGPGRLEGEVCWWFDQNTLTLLNGGIKHPETPLTRLGGERVFEIVVQALDHDYFPPDFATSCRKGECRHSRRENCPLFNWQLNHCISVRHNDPNWNKSAQTPTPPPQDQATQQSTPTQIPTTVIRKGRW